MGREMQLDRRSPTLGGLCPPNSSIAWDDPKTAVVQFGIALLKAYTVHISGGHLPSPSPGQESLYHTFARKSSIRREEIFYFFVCDGFEEDRLQVFQLVHDVAAGTVGENL